MLEPQIVLLIEELVEDEVVLEVVPIFHDLVNIVVEHIFLVDVWHVYKFDDTKNISLKFQIEFSKNVEESLAEW